MFNGIFRTTALDHVLYPNTDRLKLMRFDQNGGKAEMAGGRTTSKPTIIESLLIAQAVWEHGNDWKKVADILGGHPLAKSPGCTAEWCESTYDGLMNEAGLERTETSNKRHSPINHKLAEKYYRLRLEELRNLVLSEEAKFKAIVAQIDAIRSNKPTEPEESVQEELVSYTTPPAVHITPAPSESTRPTATPEVIEQATPSQQESDAQTPEVEASKDVDEEENEVEEEKAATPATSQPEEREESEEEAEAERREAQEEEETDGSRSPAEENEEERAPSQAPHDDLTPEAQNVETINEVEQARESPQDPRPDVQTDDEAVVSSEAKQVEEDQEMHDAEVQQEEVPSPSPVPTTPAPVAPTRKHVKRKSLPDVSAESPRDRKRVREGSETAEDEPGPSAHGARTGRRKNNAFQTIINLLHTQISANRSANIFHNPIKPSEAPDYYEIVRRPMDLKTIKNKVKDGKISNTLEYYRDIMLMFANALMYNRPDSDVYNMAKDMMHESDSQYKAIVNEGFKNVEDR